MLSNLRPTQLHQRRFSYTLTTHHGQMNQYENCHGAYADVDDPEFRNTYRVHPNIAQETFVIFAPPV